MARHPDLMDIVCKATQHRREERQGERPFFVRILSRVPRSSSTLARFHLHEWKRRSSHQRVCARDLPFIRVAERHTASSLVKIVLQGRTGSDSAVTVQVDTENPLDLVVHVDHALDPVGHCALTVVVGAKRVLREQGRRRLALAGCIATVRSFRHAPAVAGQGVSGVSKCAALHSTRTTPVGRST